MKINRKDLLWFLQNIRRRAEGQELTDEQLADKLASYMETNPGCVDINGVSNPGRFYYSTVMESLQTDLPINIEIGSHSWCESECAKSLGFKDSEEMKDPEKVKEYRRKKNDEYAKEQGYKDWDDLMANSKFGLKNQLNKEEDTAQKD